MNLHELASAVMIITPSIVAPCNVLGYLVCNRIDFLFGRGVSCLTGPTYTAIGVCASTIALWCVGAAIVSMTSERIFIIFGVIGMVFAAMISMTLAFFSCAVYYRVTHVNDNDRHGG